MAVVIFDGVETTTVTTGDVDALKFESPEYAAVMVCVPFERDAVENVAVPDVTATVPSSVVPSLKVTVPVGVPLPDCGAIVAVNFTLWPAVSCRVDALSDVLVTASPGGNGVNTNRVTEYAGNV